jgi:hypothetical protein
MRLASVLLASLASATPATIAVSTLATPAAAQELANLGISDFSTVSAEELEAAITTLVQQLRAAGYSDLEIANIIGQQLKEVSANLPLAQQRALLINVVAILSSTMPTITVADLQTQVLDGFGPIEGPVFVAQGDFVPPSQSTY